MKNKNIAQLRSRPGCVFVVVCAIAGCSDLCAQIAPLTDDAYVDSNNITANLGAIPFIHISPATRGLILFDLTRLPAGTTAGQVTVATLRLFVDKVTSAGTFDLYSANGTMD